MGHTLGCPWALDGVAGVIPQPFAVIIALDVVARIPDGGLTALAPHVAYSGSPEPHFHKGRGCIVVVMVVLLGLSAAVTAHALPK